MKILQKFQAFTLTKQEQLNINGGLLQYSCTTSGGSEISVGVYSQEHLNSWIDRNNSRANAGNIVVICHAKSLAA